MTPLPSLMDLGFVVDFLNAEVANLSIKIYNFITKNTVYYITHHHTLMLPVRMKYIIRAMRRSLADSLGFSDLTTLCPRLDFWVVSIDFFQLKFTYGLYPCPARRLFILWSLI